MEQSSLYRAAFEQALTYTEDLADRMGPQFRDTAHMEWNRDRWWDWAAERVIQHVLGEVFWAELSPETFASVSNEAPERQAILAELRQIQARLSAAGLIEFDQRDSLRERWAALLNTLLD